ncbi:hypothetical protein CVT24_001399 [Panaeolus cyanescens]|uniref:Uncharacterized protein n=1 Tax=Panaeolus cyanescens TaxID=181874 RepID=A0A409WIQ2_9AGAR|nr:hypothetical protein CVT24_001399 [Panaeolus cyanescens]
MPKFYSFIKHRESSVLPNLRFLDLGLVCEAYGFLPHQRTTEHIMSTLCENLKQSILGPSPTTPQSPSVATGSDIPNTGRLNAIKHQVRLVIDTDACSTPLDMPFDLQKARSIALDCQQHLQSNHGLDITLEVQRRRRRHTRQGLPLISDVPYHVPYNDWYRRQF